MNQRDLGISVVYFVMLEKLWLSSHPEKNVAKFGQKFVGAFKVLKVVSINFILHVQAERTTVNLGHGRVFLDFTALK